MKKRLMSLLLTLAVLLSLAAPAAAAADRETVVQGDTYINPLYEDLPAPPEADYDEDQTELQAEYRAASYISPTEAADQLRQAMVDREAVVTLNINTGRTWDLSTSAGISALNSWFFSEVFPAAYSQELAQCPYDGDYLKWSWYSARLSLAAGTGTGYAFQVKLVYYTTAQEEAELASRIAELAQTLGLDAMEPYERYTAIYDYITGNVTYDYAGLGTLEDSISGNEDYYIVTAYGALMEGKAICQGYASLFYAMCWYADLPVRTLTSSSHAWNMAYLKNIWYQVDATWDSETVSGWNWYLLGTENFDGGLHDREEEFRTQAFLTAYPLSALDYDPNSPYRDVSTDNCHYDNINSATARGLFTGMEEYVFSPAENMTRSQMVTVLWRLAGKPTGYSGSGFSDVADGQYYTEAVNWAAACGIVNGLGDNLYGPDALATREQFVTILYRYAGYLGLDVSASNDLSGFKDRAQVSPYALGAMQWAVAAGILNGMEVDRIGPAGYTTREQLASLIMRFADYYGI